MFIELNSMQLFSWILWCKECDIVSFLEGSQLSMHLCQFRLFPYSIGLYMHVDYFWDIYIYIYIYIYIIVYNFFISQWLFITLLSILIIGKSFFLSFLCGHEMVQGIAIKFGLHTYSTQRKILTGKKKKKKKKIFPHAQNMSLSHRIQMSKLQEKKISCLFYFNNYSYLTRLIGLVYRWFANGPGAIEKVAFWLPSTTVTNFTYS